MKATAQRLLEHVRRPQDVGWMVAFVALFFAFLSRPYWNWDLALPIATVLSAFGTIGTVALAWLAWRTLQVNQSMAIATRKMALANQDMVTEMRETRLAPTRPLILLEFDLEDDKLWIRVCNYGGLAANVRFAFDRPLINSKNENIGESQELSSPWPYLPPERPRKIFFDRVFNGYGLDYYLDNFDVAGRYCVTVNASDPATGEEYPPAKVLLDVRWLMPTDPAPPPHAVHLETEGNVSDRYDELLAGLEPPADSFENIRVYCESRDWKADVTSWAEDGATCVTIWPIDEDLSAGSRIERALGRQCVVPEADDLDGARALLQAARAALCVALDKRNH